MKSAGAALGDERYLCAGTLPLVCPIIRRGHSEFLNRILSHGKNRGKGVSIRLIVHVDVVECDVTLIAACSIHSPIARVLVLVTDAIARVSNSSLQAEQVGNVPPLQRDSSHLCFVKGIAERRINHVNGWGLGRDRDEFGRRANLELNVDRGRSIHQQRKVLLFISAKACCFYRECVASGNDQKKLILALISSFYGALGLRFVIRKHNGGAKNGVATGIRYRAANRRGGLRVNETAAEHASQQSQGQSQLSGRALREPRTKHQSGAGQGVISSHIFPFPNAMCFGD